MSARSQVLQRHDRNTHERADNAVFRAIVIAFVACLVVGQMVKPKLGGVPTTSVDLLILAALPISLLRMRASFMVYAGFAAFLLPSILLGLGYWLESSVNTTRLFMGLYSCYRFIFPLLLVFCFSGRLSARDRSWCVRLLLFGVGFHVIFGLVQAVALPNFALEYGPKDVVWDYQENRLVSTFLDPNLMSSLFYAVVLGILCFISGLKMRANRKLTAAMLGASFAGALTASRGGALGFALVFCVYLLENRDLSIRARVKWAAVSVLLGAIVLGGFVLFFGMDFIQRTDRFGASNLSVTARLINAAILVDAFVEKPVFGHGFNFLPYLAGNDFIAVTGNYADGGILYLFASAGVFGVFAMAIVVILASRLFERPRILMYPLALLVVQSATTSSMYYPLLTIFVVLFALTLDGGTRRAVSKQECAQQLAAKSA